MFTDIKEPKRNTMIENIVKYFNAEKTEEFDTIHVHGQRINIQKLKELKFFSFFCVKIFYNIFNHCFSFRFFNIFEHSLI